MGDNNMDSLNGIVDNHMLDKDSQGIGLHLFIDLYNLFRLSVHQPQVSLRVAFEPRVIDGRDAVLSRPAGGDGTDWNGSFVEICAPTSLGEPCSVQLIIASFNHC